MTGSSQVTCLSLYSSNNVEPVAPATRPLGLHMPSALTGPHSLSSAGFSALHRFFQDSPCDLSLSCRKTHFCLLRSSHDAMGVCVQLLYHITALSMAPSLLPVSTQISCPSPPRAAWSMLSAFTRQHPSLSKVQGQALLSNSTVWKMPESRCISRQ